MTNELPATEGENRSGLAGPLGRLWIATAVAARQYSTVPKMHNEVQMVRWSVRKRSVAIVAGCLGVAFTCGWVGTAVASHDQYHIGNFYPGSGAALCDDFGDVGSLDYEPCRTDGISVSAWVDMTTSDCPMHDAPGLSSTAEGNVRTTLAGRIEPTDLTVAYVSPALCPGNVGGPVISGSNETDIIYKRSGLIPEDYLAWTWCDDSVSTLVCDQHYTDIVNLPDTATTTTLCHETGHAVGLMHGDYATVYVANDNEDILKCMVSPLDEINDPYNFGNYNVFSINNGY